MSGDDDSIQTVGDYAGLMRRNSFLGGIMAVALGSLAGIPPMAGFAAKLLLFIAAFKAGLYGLLGVALLGVVISIYYYFNWMRQAVFVPYSVAEEGEAGADTRGAVGGAGFWTRTVLTTLALMTVGLGFWQGFLSW
jgi:NADH-quinone oxidoreductase subunit N